MSVLSQRAPQNPDALSEPERRLVAVQQRQDRLLYIACYLLLNLAEDVFVEVKMKKKVRVPKQTVSVLFPLPTLRCCGLP